MRRLGSAITLGLWVILLTGCVRSVDPHRAMLWYHEQAVKAGTASTEIDYDDPLFQKRTVLLHAGLNPLTASSVIRQLMVLDAQTNAPIDLIINSSGGHLDQALAIIDVMESLESPVNTWALGKCHSGGLMILMAGTGTRRTYPNTMLMIHGPEVTSGKPPEEVKRFVLERCNALYRRRCQLPQQWLPIKNGDLHFVTPELAVQYGLADEIVALNQ